jgi:hypothetical protein
MPCDIWKQQLINIYLSNLNSFDNFVSLSTVIYYPKILKMCSGFKICYLKRNLGVRFRILWVQSSGLGLYAPVWRAARLLLGRVTFFWSPCLVLLRARSDLSAALDAVFLCGLRSGRGEELVACGGSPVWLIAGLVYGPPHAFFFSSGRRLELWCNVEQLRNILWCGERKCGSGWWREGALFFQLLLQQETW